MPKIVIISAPSGTGKSSVIEQIISDPSLSLAFSISATSRAPRGNEQHGVEYYFLSVKEFQKKVDERAFLEYVEVYPGCYYGTLLSEVDRIDKAGKNLLLDIDVEGALAVKRQFADNVLAIFLAPPSLGALQQRLEKRGTDSPDVIAERLKRAEYELSLSPHFDQVIINDKLAICVAQVREVISQFLIS